MLSQPSSVVLARYARHGLLGGLLLGLVVGVVAVGPYFYVWPGIRSASAIAGAGVFGALAGRAAAWLALSFLVHGVSPGTTEHEDGVPLSSPDAGLSSDESAAVGASSEHAP